MNYTIWETSFINAPLEYIVKYVSCNIDFHREWYANASCDYLFRRRPLAGAFTHPSCMVYPTGDQEPQPEPEPEPVPVPDATEWRRPSYTVESFENPSKYGFI